MPKMIRNVAWTVGIVLVGAAVWYAAGTHRSDSSEPPLAAESSEPIPKIKNVAIARTEVTPLASWARADQRSSMEKFGELRFRAEAGDVIAQRDLAELYSRCSAFSLSPSNMYATLDVYARMRGVPDGSYDSIKKRFAAACSDIDGGQVIPQEAYVEWFKKAASQGDAYAKVAIASMNWSSLGEDDFRSLARDVVNSADPEAIFALGDLLALAPETADLGDFKASTTGPYANYAWGIVACRMGADCGNGSFRMDALCMNTGMCGRADFESAIRTDAVPTGQQEALDVAVNKVQAIVVNKPS